MIYLVDTNVLVYAFDVGDPERAARARVWLDALMERGVGALSVHALTEFANVALRRMQPAWHPGDVSTTVLDLSRAFDVVPVTPLVVVEALRGVDQYGSSFFDAQMWAAARLHQIPYLLTEDMAGGTTIDGVTVIDPFVTDPMLE